MSGFTVGMWMADVGKFADVLRTGIWVIDVSVFCNVVPWDKLNAAGGEVKIIRVGNVETVDVVIPEALEQRRADFDTVTMEL